jgi:hypothetical protein
LYVEISYWSFLVITFYAAASNTDLAHFLKHLGGTANAFTESKFGEKEFSSNLALPTLNHPPINVAFLGM